MNFDIFSKKILNNKGLLLSSEIYKPHKLGPLPFVFILHGFTGYKEEINLVDIAKRLADVGIGSIRFTTSGFGDSEGTLAHDYCFSNYVSDVESVYEYVRSLSYVDTKRIGMLGHSMGGKLSLLFTAKHPEISALCLISAPTQFFSTSYGKMKEEWKKKGYFEKISSRDGKTIRIPYSYVLDVDNAEFDARSAAGSIIIPSLVIAGTSDDMVSWQDTKIIFDALGTKNKQWLLLDDVDHRYKNRIELLCIVHAPIVRFFISQL